MKRRRPARYLSTAPDNASDFPKQQGRKKAIRGGDHTQFDNQGNEVEAGAAGDVAQLRPKPVPLECWDE